MRGDAARCATNVGFVYFRLKKKSWVNKKSWTGDEDEDHSTRSINEDGREVDYPIVLSRLSTLQMAVAKVVETKRGLAIPPVNKCFGCSMSMVLAVRFRL